MIRPVAPARTRHRLSILQLSRRSLVRRSIAAVGFDSQAAYGRLFRKLVSARRLPQSRSPMLKNKAIRQGLYRLLHVKAQTMPKKVLSPIVPARAIYVRRGLKQLRLGSGLPIPGRLTARPVRKGRIKRATLAIARRRRKQRAARVRALRQRHVARRNLRLVKASPRRKRSRVRSVKLVVRLVAAKAVTRLPRAKFRDTKTSKQKRNVKRQLPKTYAQRMRAKTLAKQKRRVRKCLTALR
jgi:hypothetical protein